MSSEDKPIGSILEGEPLVVGTGEAMAVSRDIFGVEGRAEALQSERDANFHIRDADGGQYLLKFTNPGEPVEVTDLQTRALGHIAARDPALPTPRIVNSRAGELMAEWRTASGEICIVRLLTFLPGEPIHNLPGSAALRANIGTCLARLDLALSDFVHPAADHELLWDIKNAGRLRAWLSATTEPVLHDLVAELLDRFEAELRRLLPDLRWQVVHNDFNPHNLLADPGDGETVTGILDFGDMVRTPLVCDLAIAASYHVSESGHPLAGIADMVRAFHQLLPLRPEEIAVLFDLIALRLATTIAITNWRASKYPDHRRYILRNAGPARAGLLRFAELGPCEGRAFLMNIGNGD